MKNSKLIIYLFSFLIFSATACSVEEESNCQNISGVWEGVYICAQGETKVTLIIEQDECELSAIFNFSESPNNPGVPLGASRFIGSIDINGQFELIGTEWIDQPEGWKLLDVTGTTTISNSNIQVTICGVTTVLDLQ